MEGYNIYNEYKPLRNFCKKLDKIESLIHIWHLFQNIEQDKALPADFIRINNGRASIKGAVYPWELSILTREVILNSGNEKSKNLLRAKDLSIAINHIRRINDCHSKEKLEQTIFRELNRIIQQQFPWQRNLYVGLARYFKIYNKPEIEKILSDETGLTILKRFFLGFALIANFGKRPNYNTDQTYSEFGITEEQKNKFLDSITIDLEDLRERTELSQEYNENWIYTINPLIKTPLIRISRDLRNRVICPMPSYLAIRLSEGLFFDLAGNKGFEEPYGKAFESYIGEISEKIITRSDIKIEKCEKYSIGKNIKHGADWIICDDDSALVIECKTKSLKLKSKYDINEDSFNEDIDVLTKAIVQNYKNMFDIMNNQTKWKAGKRKLYPVVVTLTDWNIFTPTVFERLEAKVTEKLIASGLDKSLIESNPYTVTSSQELETALQVANQVSLTEVISKKISPDYKNWMTVSLITSKFPEELAKCKQDYLLEDLATIIENMTPTQKKQIVDF